MARVDRKATVSDHPSDLPQIYKSLHFMSFSVVSLLRSRFYQSSLHYQQFVIKTLALFYLGVLPVSEIKINNAGTMWGICIAAM